MQQDTTSMTVNAPSVNTLDGGNSKNNATQEHGAMDSDASFLSDFGAGASQVGVNAMNEFSPIGNQVASPIGNIVFLLTNVLLVLELIHVLILFLLGVMQLMLATTD